jgi:hypothetical protein
LLGKREIGRGGAIAPSRRRLPREALIEFELGWGLAGARIPTKAPLAIDSPANWYLDWQLGRLSHRRWWYDRVLAEY